MVVGSGTSANPGAVSIDAMTSEFFTLEAASIVHAEDDLLHTADGHVLVDLFTAHGTTWLGHGRREVRQALATQLERVWITGGYPTPAVQTMKDALDAFLPEGFVLACLASTGMEANEQALRIARCGTGRNRMVGFAGAMHGKSFATAALAWDNDDGLVVPQIVRVASGPDEPEDRMLARVEAALATGQVAAVYVEPIHGTSLGWEASFAFHRALRALTHEHGTLLVYDEVLTGFHRTGTRFRCERHGVEPDLIVFGKACGNGFPVAGVAARADLPLQPRMLLGSTFSNNALAAAAVTATLSCLSRLEPVALVRNIERVVLDHLGWAAHGDRPRLRGAGALWVFVLDTAEQAGRCLHELHVARVCVGRHGRQLRLLPSLTISPANLERACATLDAVLRPMFGSSR